MNAVSLYPLRFDTIDQYRPWGGEAWVLSDRDDPASRVAHGPLKGETISQLLRHSREPLLGKLAGQFNRFPLLLKFLEVRTQLSVQVHPSDAYPQLIPAGDTGKSEAWIVLTAGPAARIFAGLRSGTSRGSLRQAIANGTVPDLLAGFTPQPGDAVFIPAGTVHSLRDVVVFEVQQNSDVTFRLYDWDSLDPRTGQRRALQVDQAMACIDFAQGAVGPTRPLLQETEPVLRETLIRCEQFAVTRATGQCSFEVGAERLPLALVCLAGRGLLECAGENHTFDTGDVLLLPAAVGRCVCRPHGAVSLLEISPPDVISAPLPDC
jgi:mannose-6-phosphate isomerase